VAVLRSTGMPRDELVRVILDQVEPQSADELRRGRQTRITRVQGKACTERTVFLSADARLGLADYLEWERAGGCVG
jgi:site-specific recombinase XerD